MESTPRKLTELLLNRDARIEKMVARQRLANQKIRRLSSKVEFLEEDDSDDDELSDDELTAEQHMEVTRAQDCAVHAAVISSRLCDMISSMSFRPKLIPRSHGLNPNRTAHR